MTVQYYRIPRIQRALVATGPGSLALRPVLVPKLAADEVLVQVRATALNPSDHKLLDQSTTVGAISGADFAGIVVRLGPATLDDKHNLKVGDHVLGFVFGANPGRPGNGAFAQYVAVPARLCIRVPKHSRKYEFPAAASLAMGLATVGLVLRQLGIQLGESWETGDKPSSLAKAGDYVFVHGGATATGTLLIQLLRLAGYKPIATCSEANEPLVRSRGAVATFDYHSPTVQDDIREFTGHSLKFAVDCFGTAETMTLCYGVLGDHELERHENGTPQRFSNRYIALEQYPRQLTIRRRDVLHEWILAWTVQGKEVKLAGSYYRPPGPQVLEDRKYGEMWAAYVERLLEEEKIEPHPLEVYEDGGLAAIPMKLDELRNGRIRGKKMAVCV
jgi:aspyridone synthetase trans-acting enoyl reductase